MIIYNTTFCVEEDLAINFLVYLKDEYIPVVLEQKMLEKPRLCEVLSTQADQEGRSFSLQFSVKNIDVFNCWFEQYGNQLLNKLFIHFQKKVLFFSTFLDEISLTY